MRDRSGMAHPLPLTIGGNEACASLYVPSTHHMDLGKTIWSRDGYITIITGNLECEVRFHEEQVSKAVQTNFRLRAGLAVRL